jgi:hypothetical protein
VPLARRVRADQRNGDAALNTRNEDQLPGPALPHPGHDRLRDPQCAKRIEVEQPLDLLDGHRLHRRPHGRARVAHENVDRASRGDGRADRSLIGDVELQSCHRGHVSEHADISRGRDDLMPSRGQFLGDPAADAARRSRDQDPAHV